MASDYSPACGWWRCSLGIGQAAIIALFRVVNRYVGNLPPMPGVFGGRAGMWLTLHKFDGGDRPPPIMALDRDPQAVKFVKPDILYRTGLSVREDHGLSDKLRASLLEGAKYCRG